MSFLAFLTNSIGSTKPRKHQVLHLLCLLGMIFALSGCQEVVDDAVDRTKAVKELGNDFLKDPGGVACDMLDPQGPQDSLSETTKAAIKKAENSSRKWEKKVREFHQDIDKKAQDIYQKVERKTRDFLDLEQETDDPVTSGENKDATAR